MVLKAAAPSPPNTNSKAKRIRKFIPQTNLKADEENNIKKYKKQKALNIRINLIKLITKTYANFHGKSSKQHRDTITTPIVAANSIFL